MKTSPPPREAVSDSPVHTARRVALIGNPNVGKTTLFNHLTGLRQKTGNYPGVTVERKSGKLAGHDAVEIIDLPGSYSLSPKSLDERIAYDVLSGHLDAEPRPDLVVCVVDASVLERNLFLVSQVIDLRLPVIVALNMMDAATTAGLQIDVEALSGKLGVPVLPMVASRNEGVDGLIDAIARGPLPECPDRKWELMPAVDQVLPELYAALDRTTRTNDKVAALRAYFESAPAEDAAWALAFLTGQTGDETRTVSPS